MKRFLTVLLLLTLALTTCDNGKDTHTHEWGAWQSDATQHWKECTANDGAKTDVANHTGNPCTVCGYESASVPQPKIIDNTNGLAFDGKVTISTSDPYTVADWNAVVADLITAFNAAYTDPTAPGPVKGQFETAFANNANAQIVLVNNLANNWEVRDGEFRTLYLKTSSIATVVYRNAVQRMLQSTPSVGKATPPKDRVFLA